MNKAAQSQFSRTIKSVPTCDLPTWYLNARHWLVCLAILMSLPLLLPVVILVSLSIKLESRGSILFTAPRVGLHGRIFTMYKFRTMNIDSQAPFKLTEEGDTRITRVGRIVRATHFDELPQIWNILRGEMDFIGPRPVPLPLYAFYQEEIPDYDNRHALRPGITGLAQVHLGYTTTLEGEKRKWAYDIEYLAKLNFVTDIQILLWTLFILVRYRKVSDTNVASQNIPVRIISQRTSM